MRVENLEQAANLLKHWVINNQALAKRMSYVDQLEKTFSERLFDLLQKAKPQELAALRQVFPFEVAVYEEWRDSPTEIGFYKKFKIA